MLIMTSTGSSSCGSYSPKIELCKLKTSMEEQVTCLQEIQNGIDMDNTGLCIVGIVFFVLIAGFFIRVLIRDYRGV